jgi:hypothetical protein
VPAGAGSPERRGKIRLAILTALVGAWLFNRRRRGRDVPPAAPPAAGMWTDVLSDYHDPCPPRTIRKRSTSSRG